MPILYDSRNIYDGILLDLPVREGVGTITKDLAKPHHPVSLVGAPTWATLPTGLGVLSLNGVNQYLECLAADCADLDFTASDYSIGCWINWTDTGTSEIIVGRYRLDVSGWEIYLTNSGAAFYLTERHHHAGGPSVRTACYSAGWTPGTTWFMGISRVAGGEGLHYRNGVPLTMTTGGLLDPETCAQDLVIGARFTKNSTFYKNWWYRLRIWPKALTANDWKTLYELEKALV